MESNQGEEDQINETNKLERIREESDYECTQLQLDAKMFVDSMLDLKPEGHMLNIIGIDVIQDAHEVRDSLEGVRVSEILAADDENVAMESDGSYYPILDLRKGDSELIGVGASVYGTQSQKYRDVVDAEYPHLMIDYPGEEDWEREVSLGFSYRSPDGKYFIERVRLRATSYREGSVSIGSSVYSSDYAEMGYEGHGFRILEDATEDDMYEFMKIVSEAVGDTPKTHIQRDQEEFDQTMESVSKTGDTEVAEQLIDASWTAQAMYLLTTQREQLDGNSVVDALAMADYREEALSLINKEIKQYRLRRELRDLGK